MSVLSKLQLEKYADVLIWGLNIARPGFKKYDTILVRCDLEGKELGEILNRKLVQARYNVVFRFMASPQLERDFYMHSDQAQRKFIAAGDKEFFRAVNGNIYIHAPASLTHLKGIDTKRQSETAIARCPKLKALARQRQWIGQDLFSRSPLLPHWLRAIDLRSSSLPKV